MIVYLDMGRGSDTDLPAELLAVLPADPFDQLEIARKITALAVTSRVEQLEAEAADFRQQLAEKDMVISSLQERVGQLQQALQQCTNRLSSALDEQAKVTTEKNSLVGAMKKLNRDVAKLEAFKKTLMLSLKEDDETQSHVSDDKHSTNRLWALDSSLSSLSSLEDLTPQLTTSGSPKRQTAQSAATSPRGRSGAGTFKAQSTKSSPRWQSLGEGRFSLPQSLPTSHHSTAPNSPPRAGSHPAWTPRVDAKEFFRQVRSRLSYEQFSAFLANIKELNAHKQTREETLKKADEIFGPNNKDLLIAFDGLLSRHR